MELETCTKMLKKLSERFRAKISRHAHGYAMVKFAHLDVAFLGVFLIASKPSRRPITAAKRKEKEKKGKAKKNSKIKA